MNRNLSATVLREARLELLQLVDEFMAEGGASVPIETMNDLLYRWLTTPGLNMSSTTVQNQLFTAHLVINFLSNLDKHNQRINHLQTTSGPTAD